MHFFESFPQKKSPKSFLDSEVNWSNYPWIAKITVKKVWTLKNWPSVFPLKLLQLPNTVLKTRGFFTSNLADHHIVLVISRPSTFLRNGTSANLDGIYPGSLVNRKLCQTCETLLPHEKRKHKYILLNAFSSNHLQSTSPPKKKEYHFQPDIMPETAETNAGPGNITFFVWNIHSLKLILNLAILCDPLKIPNVGGHLTFEKVT